MANVTKIKLGPSAITRKPNGKWFLRKMVNGQPIQRILDVDAEPTHSDRIPAEVRAEAQRIIGLALAGKTAEVAATKQRRDRVATIGEIIERYRNHDRVKNLKPVYVRSVITDFTRLIATVLDIHTELNAGSTNRAPERLSVDVGGSAAAAAKREAAVSGLSSNVLTAELIGHYVTHRYAQGPKIYAFEKRPPHMEPAKPGEWNDLDLERIKKSTGTVIAHARALFAHKSKGAGNLICPVKGIYTDMRLPDTLEEFKKCFTFPTPEDPEYEIPTTRVLSKLWNGLPALKTENPEAYKVFKIAVDTGLRLNEIRFLMWEQINELPDMVQITVKNNGVNGGTKSGKSRPVKLSGGLYRELCEMETSETYVVGGGHEFRKWQVGKDVSAWMRAMGWKRRQCAHEMRKWMGAQVAHQTKDLLAVSRILGHQSYRTTRGTYEAMVSYPKYSDLTATLPGSESSVTAVVQSRAVGE